jgi:phospholipase/carboxylesterase
MALWPAARERPAATSAIPGCSGSDGAGPEAVSGEIKARPPVLLVHGDRDDLIPAQALCLSAQYRATLEIPTEWHMSPGIGHGIDEEGLRHGGEFLARRFGVKRS